MSFLALSFTIQVMTNQVIAEHETRPSQIKSRTVIQSVCGRFKTEFIYGNGSARGGFVESIKVNENEVKNGAQILSVHAINRVVNAIRIQRCGIGARLNNYMIAYMDLAPEPISRGGRPPRVYFELSSTDTRILSDDEASER